MIEWFSRCAVTWTVRTVPILLGAWLLLPPESAQAGTRRDDVADSNYTGLASQAEFQSVGKVTATGLGSGSGTLISSQWVLTAGHVVSFPDPSSVIFRVNGVDYTADDWFPHASWNDDIGDNGFDIGLIRLSAAVAGVTPALRYSTSNELGATATIVGFGDSGTGLTGEQVGTFGTKRAGNNVLDALGSSAGDHNNYLMADFDNPSSAADSSFGSSAPLAFEYSSAQGDSGGGVFINDGGVQKVAGIVSFGQNGPVASPDGSANSDYGDLMGFTRVSTFNDWIDDNAASQWVNGSGGSAHTAGNWQNSYLPDSTDILRFDVTGTYTTTFSGANAYSKFLLRKGSVTFDLGGSTQTVTSPMLTGSVTVGRDNGDNAGLTLTNGTLASVDAFVGRSGGSGSVTLNSGGQWTLSTSLYLGGSNTASGGAGSLTVNAGGSVQVADTLRMWSNSGLVLNGGTVSTGNFIFNGGTITGSAGGSLTANGSGSSWTGGTIYSGPTLNIASGGRLTIAPSSPSGARLNNAFVEIAGTAILSGTSGSVVTESNTPSTVQIVGTGVFDMQSSNGFSFGITGNLGIINNAGTFKRTTNTGSASISSAWTFNNTGTLKVESGTLQISGAFNNSAGGQVQVQAGTLSLFGGGTSAGSFSTSPGANLNFGNGTHDLTGATFTNAGTVQFGGGTVNFNNPVTIDGTVIAGTGFSGGTINFNQGAELPGTTTWDLTTTNTSANVTFRNVTATRAYFGGGGNFTIPYDPNPVNNGLLTFNGNANSVVHYLGFLTSGTLNINGNANFVGTQSFTSYNGSTAVVNIASTGVVDLRSTSGFAISGTGTGTLNNAGTFRKSVDSGSASVSGWTFNNTGSVEVQSGTLGMGAIGTNTGSFVISAGAQLQFGGVPVANDFTNASIANNGTIRFIGANSGGTSTFGAPVTLGGNIEITDIGAGNVHWLLFNATANLPGTTVIGSRGRIGGSGQVAIKNLTWAGGGGLDGSVTVDIPSDGQLTFSPTSESYNFDSVAKINVAGSAILPGTRNIRANSGANVSFNILPGGVLDLQDSGGFSAIGQGTLNNAGTFRKSVNTGTATTTGNWTFNNTGTVEVKTGTLSISGTFNQTQASGRILLSGGTFSKSGTLTIQAGSIEGTGTIAAAVQNYGTISPGQSPEQLAGKLTFNGNLTLFGDAHTHMELGGLTPMPITQFDQIAVTGAVVLGGALDVNLIDAGLGLFAPAVGNVFDILTATGNITGTFATTSLPALAGGLLWNPVQYGLHSIQLQVGGIVGDYNHDGTVNTADYVVWRKSQGQTGLGLAADGNGDHAVTELDYGVWRSNFGLPAGSGTALNSASISTSVPEPTSPALLMLAAAFGGVVRFRARS